MRNTLTFFLNFMRNKILLAYATNKNSQKNQSENVVTVQTKSVASTFP